MDIQSEYPERTNKGCCNTTTGGDSAPFTACTSTSAVAFTYKARFAADIAAIQSEQLLERKLDLGTSVRTQTHS
jgi:hypothetical protein